MGIKKYRHERKSCVTPEQKIKLLIRMSNVKYRRLYKDRSLGEIRAAANRSGAKPKGKHGNCWVCGKYAILVRHHVIQLQNGGSNWHLNIEMICDECHAAIHPWLESEHCTATKIEDMKDTSTSTSVECPF